METLESTVKSMMLGVFMRHLAIKFQERGISHNNFTITASLNS